MASRAEGWDTDMPTAAESGIKPAALPLSVQQQQMQLARKQQLVQAMMGQQLQDKGGTQMAGNIAIKKSPFEALSQALSAGLLANKQKELDERGNKIGEDYNTLGQQEMQKYLDTANGTPADPRTILPEGMTGPQDKGAPADPRRALTEGLMAQHADVRAAMIAKQKAEEARQLMRERRQMEGLTDQEAVKSMQDPASLAQAKGKANLQGIAPNSTVVTESGEAAPPLPKEARMKQKVDSKGNLLQVNPWNESTDQIDKAQKVSVQNTANIAGPKAGAEALWKGVETDLAERRKALGGGQALLGTLKDMEQLDANGMYNSTGADVVSAVAKAGQLVGVPVDANTLANTTAYRSAQTKIWQNLVSQMGGNKGVTKEEAEEIKQIIPRVNDDPEGRKRIIQILRNSHARGVQEYGRMANAAKLSYQHDNPTIYHEDLGKLYTEDGSPQQPAAMPTVPGAPATPLAAPMSASEYLKQNRR